MQNSSVVIEIRKVENGNLAVLVNNTLVGSMSLLASDTWSCVLMLHMGIAKYSGLQYTIYTVYTIGRLIYEDMKIVKIFFILNVSWMKFWGWANGMQSDKQVVAIIRGSIFSRLCKRLQNPQNFVSSKQLAL